jgi:amino acid adenylation domain-containing protein/FkbM family methyltransferase
MQEINIVEERLDGYLLSPQQARLWQLQQGGGAQAYRAQCLITIEGQLSPVALKAATEHVVNRHEIFRTSFQYHSEMKVPVQVIEGGGSPVWRQLDLRGSGIENEAARLDELFESEGRRPFDFDRPPLIRLCLASFADERHALLITLPALCADTRTLRNLVSEISFAYAARLDRAKMDEDVMQYVQFSAWQNELLEAEEAAEGKEFWRRQVETLPKLKLPSEKHFPESSAYEPQMVTAKIEPGLSARVEALARQSGSDASSFLLACWQTLCWRLTGQADVVVGCLFDERTYEELRGSMGLISKSLPVRSRFDEGARFSEIWRRLDGSLRESGDWQEYFAPAESAGGFEKPAEFPDIGFDFDNEFPPSRVGSVTLTMTRRYVCLERFKLRLSCSQIEHALRLEFHYDTNLFAAQDVERLAEEFLALVESAAARPDALAGDLDLLGRAERAQLLTEFSGQAKDYPLHLCLHQFFETQAERTPEQTAVIFDEDRLTYAELNGRANQLAHHLRSLGVGTETLVGVYLERSLEMAVALLGILKAGGAYLPIDPAYPKERVDYILSDSCLPVLLTQEGLRENLPAHYPQVVALDKEWETISRQSAENPASEVTAEQLAYVIYTSGSTGNPKGAMLHHKGVVNCLLWMQETYGLDETDRFLLKTSLNFDPSVWEFFWPLSVGASVVIAQPAGQQDTAYLVRTIIEHEITSVYFVPSQLGAILNEPQLQASRSLKRVICGGESLSQETLRRFYARLASVELHHSYGPTETSIAATEWTSAPDAAWPVAPIGKPLANTQIYVLDAAMRPTPLGIPGELYIGGVAVGRGYLRRPELTAERFVPHLFSDEAGARLYRTGDLVRYLPDGNVEFLGRTDFQVKLRGFRIEPGEIEAVVKRHEAVGECVVAMRQDASLNKRLVAYVTGTREAEPTAAELREFVTGKLPDYMLPAEWVMLDEMPLTPGGKVDRRALPELVAGGVGREQSYVAPRTPVQEVLAGIWAEVLGVERVGIRDNFFELGGHSLLATQVISRVTEAVGVEVPLAYLFDLPTVETLSARVEEAVSAGYKVQVPPIERIPREGQLALSFAQQRLWFLHQLEPDSAAYNILTVIQLSGDLNLEALERALSEVSRRHESLRTRFETVDGQPTVSIDEPAAVKVPVVDLAHLAADEREREARRLAAAEQEYSFDLARGPLVRVNLLRFAPDNQVLLVSMHHIITDGWSTDVLSREMTALYHAYSEGQPSPLAELPIQYVDFAQWQREWLRHAALDAQLSYWRRHLGGNPPSLQLPTDRARASTPSSHGAHQDAVIDEALTASLKAFSRREGVTLFMTLLAAFKTLLYRHTGQEDILVGIPIAGRNRAETEGLIGLFLNTLVLRTDLSGSPSFRELLKREREVALGAYAHQDVPFEKLVAELQPDRELGRNPFFDVMVNFINAPTTLVGLEASNLNYTELTEQQAQLPLMLIVRDEGAQLALRLLYQDALFSSEKIYGLLDQFQHLLAQVVQSPEASLDSYSLVTPDTQSLLPDASVPLDEPAYDLMPEMCRVWAREMPLQIAVKQGDRVLTYGELIERATRLAQILVAEGVGRGEVVTVTGQRSIGLITSMLAVLMSGGVLLSSDRNLPAERQRLMLDQSKSKFMLYAGEPSPEDAWLAERQSLVIKYVNPHDGRATDAGASAEHELPALAPDDAAYIFFTSGTTGIPKGTLGNHKGLSHFLTWQRETFGINSQDRAAQLTALSFDVVLRDIFTPLVSGATLCLPLEAEDFAPEDFIPWLAQEKITLLHAVPSLAQFWLAHAAAKVVATDLRWAFFAGEPLSDVLVRRWREVFPEAGVVNLYGPTETTLAKCYYEVPAEPSPGVQPVGRPLPQTQALILNRQDGLCGTGEPGEIVIRTPFRTYGYINATAENQARFVKNFFRADEQDLLYRTGDSGRYRLDGSIEILGRIDNQVKIRGVRIEPEEIETALVRHPALREAVVVAREDKPGDKQLVAYVVPEPKHAPTVAGRPRYRLPNNMAIVHLNKNESDYLYREVFELQAYIRHGITIDDGAFILDVGANIGLFSLYAQQMARATKIFAFEPTPVTFATLKTNISLYGSDVTLFNFGISSENKTATFTFFPRFSFLTGLYADPETEKEVVKAYVVSQQKTGDADLSQIEAEADEILEDRFAVETFDAQLRTLSSVIEEHRIEQVDLLKINVEKSELDVLQGIKPEDWRKIKQLVMEVDVQGNLVGIEALLKQHGFAYVVEQDIWLTETPLCYVYAVRDDLQEKLIVEQERGVHARPVPALDAPFLTSMELKRYAAERLPLYMIPSVFVMMDELPLTPNGKVDRRALPAPDANAAEQRDAYAPPRNHIEEALTEIWAEVLGVERVGIYDNFFESGGHSLVVTRMISRVRKAFEVELSVRTVFERATIAELAATIETTLGFAGGAAQAPPITRISREGRLGLSFSQEYALAKAQREGRHSFYARLLTFTGQLDRNALERAFDDVIRRHESLRTTFVQTGGETVQVINEPQPFHLPVVDLSALPPEEREERALQMSREYMREPFDVERGPLLRLVLFRLDDERHMLYAMIAHIICDLWSLRIVNEDVATLYNAYTHGQPSPLPALTIQYPDIARWEREWLQGEVFDNHVSYWKRLLKDSPLLLPLPVDHPRPPLKTYRSGEEVLQIPDALHRRLMGFSQREAVTPSMTMMAAFQLLLHRYTEVPDILIGTASAGRNRIEVEGVIGNFINMLVRRASFGDNPTFREVLRRLREFVAASHPFEELPFGTLVEHLGIEQDPGYTPVVQCVFVLHHLDDEQSEVEFQGLRMDTLSLDTGTVAYELIMHIHESSRGLFVGIDYHTDVFGSETIKRILGHYHTLLEAIAQNSEQRISELPVLTADERAKLLVEWNATKVAFARDGSVSQLIEAQAAMTPDAPAIACGEEKLTYRKLNEQANQLAHHLGSRGLGREETVAVCLPDGAQAVTALLGILKAGGAYLLLDPARPPEHLAGVLKNAGARLLVAEQAAETFAGLDIEVLSLTAAMQSAGGQNKSNPGSAVSGGEQLAQVSYYSKTAGQPVVSEITHRALLNLISWQSRTRGHYSGSGSDMDRIACACIHAATWTVWAALACGACVHLPDDKNVVSAAALQAWLADEAITIAHLPAPLTESMMSMDWTEATALRAIFATGGRLNRYPSPGLPFKVINYYSAMGAAGVVAAGEVAPQADAERPPSFGRPVDNAEVFILDSSMNLMPVGVEGELFVGGEVLARGYLDRADLTAGKFVPHPFSDDAGARLYKTGDIAKRLPDGSLQLCGRAVDRVDLNGTQIKLGDVEFVLAQHDAVQHVEVQVQENAAGERSLIAQIEVKQGSTVSEDELRVFTAARLPRYSIPERFVLLDALPLVPHTKVGRAAL